SHPCIIAWVPVNESWGVQNVRVDPAQQHFVRALYHLTKALDPTRPVIGNDGWEYLCGDICGIHDYTFFGDVIRERYGTAEAMARTIRAVQPGQHFITISELRPDHVPIVLSELGGLSYPPAETAHWYGCGTV